LPLPALQLGSHRWELTISLLVGVGGAMGDATAVNMDHWDRDIRINLTSMVLMARHTIPEMRKNGRGVIVNMSSVSGRKICLNAKATRIGPKVLVKTNHSLS
jgi:NAD(P)-dependent dehydrogenase (short-subunit alcohol dehydrogenase family)